MSSLFNPDAEESDINFKARTNSVYNQMKCPQPNGLNIGFKVVTSGTTGDKKLEPKEPNVGELLDSVIHNATNYAVAYPFSGVNPDYKKGTTQSTGFYDGNDLSLGSNYFYEMGTCSPESETVCQNKPRWIYVRDIPTGKAPIIGNGSFQELTGSNLQGITESRGLVNGLLEDLSDVQPLTVMEAMSGKGNYGTHRCRPVTYPVGRNIYDDQMKGKTWDLETRCSSSYYNLNTSTNGDTQKFPLAPVLFTASVEGFQTKTLHEKENITSWYWMPFTALVLYWIFSKKSVE